MHRTWHHQLHCALKVHGLLLLDLPTVPRERLRTLSPPSKTTDRFTYCNAPLGRSPGGFSVQIVPLWTTFRPLLLK